MEASHLICSLIKTYIMCAANFKLPEEGEFFDSVEFIELQREEAQKLVDQYNKEGEEAGFGHKKGFRGGFAERRGGFMDRRGGFGKHVIGLVFCSPALPCF